MTGLLEDCLSYKESYYAAFAENKGNVLDLLDVHFGVDQDEAMEFFTFVKEEHAKEKKQDPCVPFVDGFIMGMYLVGRAYKLDYRE